MINFFLLTKHHKNQRLQKFPCFYDRLSSIFRWQFDSELYIKTMLFFFFICLLACLFLLTPGFYGTFWCKRKAKQCLTWHQIRLTTRGIMKRKQHLQSFLTVCNKRLFSATTRHAWHAGKRPSEQFAVNFLQDYLFKEKTSEFYSRACFVIFKLNLLPTLKKLKDLKMGQDITK